jgi:copper(I)-binding protein
MRNFLLFLALSSIAVAANATPVASNGWVRLVPGQQNAAAYLTFHNTGDADALTGVTSDCCKAVEIHEMVMEGEIMRMRKVDALPLPSKETVTLGPMGYHIMLIGLKAQPKEGADIPITLTFKSGAQVPVKFTVKTVGTRDDHHHGAH